MNTTTTDDEEWESAGLNLEALKLAEPIAVKSKPAFIMPARLLNRPIIGEINFLHDLPPVMQSSSQHQTQNSFSTQFAPAVVVDTTEVVDSALLNAIDNPRERMQVLNLENVLLLFVKSSERSVELPPEHNSFRRLLAYRIAHRFGLTHAVSDQLNENGERGILIYRTSDTHIPSPLLIDLPPPNDCSSDQSPFGSNQNLQEAGEAAAPVVKKMTMMKRNPNRDNDIKKESSKKEKQTAEEREKAYAEARARIFGAEAEAAATAAALNVSTGAVPIKKSISDSKLEKAVRSSSPRGGSGSGSPPPSASIGHSPAPPISSTGPKKKALPTGGKKVESIGGLSGKGPEQQRTSPGTSTSPPLDTDSGKNKKKSVDVTTWKEKKFTVRDQDAERSDPDFSRRSVSSSSTSRQHSQQFAQPPQFRSEDMAGYQSQGQAAMPSGGSGYQQSYQVPQDPYQYQGNGMMPYGPHNPYVQVQGPFMQMAHMGMSAPGSPPHQQQWQQAHPQGMMINQHHGNPYYPHLAAGTSMTPIHPPLGPGPLPMNIGMYSQIQGPIQGPIQGLGPVSGGYGGSYGPLGGLYPPLPTANISSNTYSNSNLPLSLSTEQHQNPPSV